MEIKGTKVPTADEAMKMYNFVKDWKTSASESVIWIWLLPAITKIISSKNNFYCYEILSRRIPLWKRPGFA